MAQDELTPSQTIKQVLDLLEAFGLPQPAIDKIRKSCWYLADSQPEKGNGNGMDKSTN